MRAFRKCIFTDAGNRIGDVDRGQSRTIIECAFRYALYRTGDAHRFQCLASREGPIGDPDNIVRSISVTVSYGAGNGEIGGPVVINSTNVIYVCYLHIGGSDITNKTAQVVVRNSVSHEVVCQSAYCA